MDQSESSANAARLRALTWLLVLAIIVVRNANAFFHPILFGEDGTRLFMYYMDNRGLDSLLRVYAGYVSFAANFLGWLTGTLPIVAQPFVLAANAGLIGATCLWLFSSERFRPLLGDVRLRCVACVCLALIPVGNFALMTCTMFVNWHLLLAACLLALAQAPRTTRGRILEFSFAWLCLWTNPVSIVLAPIYAWRAWRGDGSAVRAHYVGLAALAILYQLLFVQSTAETAPSVGSTIDATYALLSERVLTEPFLGSTGRYHLSMSALPLPMLWPALILAVFAWHRSRTLPAASRRILGTVGFLVLAITLAVAYARHDNIDGMLHWGYRYTYVQKLLVYLTVVILCLRTLPRTRLVAAALVTHALILGITDSRPYHTSREQGDQVMSFVREAAAWRATPHATPGPGSDALVFEGHRRKLIIRRQAR